MKAIIIARVSTEEQREAGNSLPAQTARLEKYCQNKGFEIMRSCSFDESAYKIQRDTFDSIIDYILAQKEKIAVCFDKVDRLTRNAFDKRIRVLLEKALRDELEIHFVSDNQIINSQQSATEKFRSNINFGLAQYYSDSISDSVRRAQEQKLRKGEWLSKAPFGYKNIRLENDNGDIIVNEHNAYIAKKIFELYATGAYSMALLCKKIKVDYGVVWPKSHMGKFLKNPFYHGTMIVKRKSYPHRYKPIISKMLFDQVQQVIAGFKKKPFKYAGLPFVYRGLIRCEDCGLSISPERHKKYAYYKCTEYRGKHGGKHGAKWMREEDITKQLGHVFKSLQMPKDILDQIVDTLATTHEQKISFHNSQFDKLTKEQKELTRMMDNLYLDKLKGKIGDEQYDRFYESFTTKKDDITLRLSQLQEAEDNYYVTAKYILELSKHAYDLFMSSEVEEKRQLLKLIFLNIKMKDKKLVWEAQKPFDILIEATDRKLWRP